MELISRPRCSVCLSGTNDTLEEENMPSTFGFCMAQPDWLPLAFDDHRATFLLNGLITGLISK